MSRERGEQDGVLPLPPLFETMQAKGRIGYRLFASTIMVGICFIWVHRATHVPQAGEAGRWAWIGLFLSEIWFGLYWILTQSLRWNVIHRRALKDRLLQRYGDKLPGVDIFVCTADPTIEPPTLVINTVLSVMAYDYPPEKLSIYLSDDGGSDLTFYALLEASEFSMSWIPFCKKAKLEPRSPATYFSQNPVPVDGINQKEWLDIKNKYENMKQRIETTTKLGWISDEIREQHQGFTEWSSSTTKRDHHTILQILIDGKDPNVVDNEGNPLPTLVYLAREKRPQYHHNFKAGAMNALIRVSSEISNGSVILNVDCDMYSNNSETLQDAMCFLMDEGEGQQIAFVQFPQSFMNLTANDIYGNGLRVINDLETAGMDGLGGPIYGGTGCFHRRETLCGMKYTKDYKPTWNIESGSKTRRNCRELEEKSRVLADCTYDENTQWGKEMGLKYGCPVEDVITGLLIKCRGWKSVFYNPNRKGILGIAPITFDLALVQYKRWCEGLFQIFFSKYCPFWFGRGKIKFGHQMGYCVYLLWAPTSFPSLCYVILPSLGFLHGVPLFPQISSIWVLPYAYVFMAKNAYSLLEDLRVGGTFTSWWHLQRMWLFRRVTSYLFAFVDTMAKHLGFSELTFTITAKVVDDEVSKRCEQEILEFGSSPMFIIISALALLSFASLVGGLKQLLMGSSIIELEPFVMQAILCSLLVMINIPVYEAMFLRKDKGHIPMSVTFMAIILVSFACIMPM